jgi:hypothetical protein
MFGEQCEPNILKNISPSHAESKGRGRGIGSLFLQFSIVEKNRIKIKSFSITERLNPQCRAQRFSQAAQELLLNLVDRIVGKRFIR